MLTNELFYLAICHMQLLGQFDIILNGLYLSFGQQLVAFYNFPRVIINSLYASFFYTSNHWIAYWL